MSKLGGYSQAAMPSVRVPVKTTTGVALNTKVYTSASVVDSLAVAPKGASRVGLFFNLAAEDSASSTIDIDIEQSPDKGTTWVGMPISANSETEAALAQFTAVGSKFKWWDHCGDSQYTKIRAEITIAGSTASDTITLGPCYWFFVDVD